MSESLKSIHVRLSSDAHRVLTAIADVQEKDNTELARMIIEEALFGRVHVLTLQAKRYSDPGLRGILRDFEGLPGKGAK